MRSIFTVLFLLIVTINPIFAKKIALLVGVGNIPNNRLHSKEDIVTMKKLLANKFKIISLEDDKANYKNLKSILEEMSKLKKSDTFLFYYSGHGCRAFGSVDEKDSRDEFLMLSGVEYAKDSLTIKSGIMLDDELNYRLSKIKAKKIILFDCCHSQTMYKSISPIGSKFSKNIGVIFKLGYKKNPLYSKYKIKNFIKLSACMDDEQTEDSPNGGIFTLTLKRVLQKSGNISFSKLIREIKNNLHSVAKENGRAGDYVPNMSVKNINPNKIYTKDIFVLPKTSKRDTLEDYLNSHKNRINLSIHGGTDKFAIGDTPIFVSTLKESKNHLYLLEVDNNNYQLLEATTIDKCVKSDNNRRECIFRNSVSSTPFGESKIYLISTKYPLNISTKRGYVKDFQETLKSQLKNTSFKVAKVSVFSVPKL